MSHPFSDYIKIIGKGKKGSRSLTEQEAFEAMGMLLRGEVTGEQRGAFLMLLRTQEETPAEVTGFLRACRLLINDDFQRLGVRVDIGCYAGKRRQLPWYLLAVAVLAKVEGPVLLHGAHEPGSGRLYASKVLPALGLPVASDIAEASSSLKRFQAAYLDLGDILPPLDAVIKLREWFGLRSCANTLARLLNPSLAPFAVQGVYHMHLDYKHCRVNEAFPDYDSLCFRGDGGDPEVNAERATDLLITRRGSTELMTFPESSSRWALKDKAMDVQTMLAVWRGEATHAYGNQAILATLASFLMLTRSLSVEAATVQAKALWEQRESTALPFH
ncbi:glycosyl transferase family protein [Alteromonas sp. H39]|uniref:glycosyl transferase family protein n=1 Tax=Alteromonas sp. H39 TaxID=3389876 RepID=UPI0039E0AB0F